MVDKPFEKRIRWNGGSTIGLAGCGIWLFYVVILVGMDERKACIHTQLRPGIMLQSGLSELHSCTEKVHESFMLWPWQNYSYFSNCRVCI